MKDNFFVSPSQLEDQHGRSFYLDNAKFFLIFFVVLAHASSPLKASHSSMYALGICLTVFTCQHLFSFRVIYPGGI